MISWPKAIADVRVCSPCSSCRACTSFTGLRIIHTLFPFPPVPYVTSSACAQADGKARQYSLYSNGSSWAQLAWEVAMLKLVCSGRPLQSFCCCCVSVHVCTKAHPSLQLPAASRKDCHTWTSFLVCGYHQAWCTSWRRFDLCFILNPG